MVFKQAGLVTLMVASLLAGSVRAQPPVPGDKAEQVLYVAINVNDLARSRDFYTHVVGMKEIPTPSAPGQAPAFAFLSYSGTFADTFVMLNAARKTPLQRGEALVRLVFKVRDATAAVARAKAAGYPVVRDAGPAEPGVKVGMIKDPDGNDIEIVETVPLKG